MWSEIIREMSRYSDGISPGLTGMAQLRALVAQKHGHDSGIAPPQLAAQTAQQHGCWLFARWARERDAGYWTQETIAEYLNDHGQRTARGRLWTQSNVSYLLRRIEGGDR